MKCGEELPKIQTEFKWSTKTQLLATPRNARAKYDWEYYLSFDTKVTKGKPSVNEKKPKKGSGGGGKTDELAKPRHITKKYVAPTKPSTGVSPGAKNGSASGRVTEIAGPKKINLYHTHKDNRFDKERKKKIEELLKSSTSKVPPDVQEEIDKEINGKKEKEKKLTEKQLKDLLKRNGPRKERRKRRIRRGPRRHLSYLLLRIMNEMYPGEQIYVKPDYDAPFRTDKNAMNYNITDRTTELALPKEYPDIGPLIQLGGVHPTALTYTASPTIVRLAAPKPKPNITELDMKENPFGVEPNALKYKASKRIIELAEPK